jgi:hypothetical protein
MDGRTWKAADLSRRSGLSKQVISNVLDKKRTRLARPPEDSTIEGLVTAFGGGELIRRRLWLRVAESMGLPVGSEVAAADPTLLSNDELLSELSRRLASYAVDERTAAYDPNFPAGPTDNTP